MTGFLLGALALTVLTLAFLLPPLWKPARKPALGLVLLVPLAATALYLSYGTPAALDPASLAPPETVDHATINMDDAIDQLERRLAEQPDRMDGWLLLGRSRMSQERYAEASAAFAKAHALAPDDADVMVEYADAQLRAAADGRFPDAASALLERAVAANPQHQRGLFSLGLQRLLAGRPAEAVALWERLLPLLEPATAAALQPQIDAARAAAGLPAQVAAAPAAATGPTLNVTVQLAPMLAAQLAEGDILYVFARTADGAGLPVAVKRLPASGFPLTLTLSDADGMMPAQKLSAQSQVRLMARVSKSGDVAAKAGDLEAGPQVLAVRDGAEAVLVIDRVHP